MTIVRRFDHYVPNIRDCIAVMWCLAPQAHYLLVYVWALICGILDIHRPAYIITLNADVLRPTIQQVTRYHYVDLAVNIHIDLQSLNKYVEGDP